MGLRYLALSGPEGQPERRLTLNLNAAPTGTKTDYSFALDQLQAQHPECTTVSLIVAWFGSSTDVTQCKIYPSTTFIGGSFAKLVNGSWTPRPAGAAPA